MNTTAYINGKVLSDGEMRDGLTVITRAGRIGKVQGTGEDIPAEADIIDLAGDYLLPGFIDVQVNGGGGVLFNDQPTVEGIQAIAQAHRAFGTTGLLPTLISDDIEVVEKALAAAEEAIKRGIPGVLGVHIEGPFLNPERRGVHDKQKLRALTREIVDALEPLPNGPTLLTLAPETVEAEWIAELTKKGFIVCCGHSNATQEQVQQSLDHGLRGFTHLFNAMSPLTAREPGVVGQALADEKSWCGIIADGHHVAPVSLDVAFRCKGRDRLMLVTDAMPPVGSTEPAFLLLGERITVKDGVCQDERGTLAGAALDMATAVQKMSTLTSCSFADACTMASATPAAFLGIDDERGSIAEGRYADLVIMNAQGKVKSCLVAGR